MLVAVVVTNSATGSTTATTTSTTSLTAAMLCVHAIERASVRLSMLKRAADLKKVSEKDLKTYLKKM